MLHTAQNLISQDVPDIDDTIAKEELRLARMLEERRRKPMKTVTAKPEQQHLVDEYKALQLKLAAYDSRFRGIAALPRRPKGLKTRRFFDLRVERCEDLRRLLELETILGF